MCRSTLTLDHLSLEILPGFCLFVCLFVSRNSRNHVTTSVVVVVVVVSVAVVAVGEVLIAIVIDFVFCCCC